MAWEVISADGHKVSGALTFSIGTAAAAGAASSRAPTSVDRPALGGRRGSPASFWWSLSAWPCLVLAAPTWCGTSGFGAAVLLAPLHQLVDDGRGLGGLSDWLTWLDGVTRPSSLLLLAAYAAAAAARSVPRRVMAAVITVPALVLLGGAAYSWPQGEPAPATSPKPSGPATATADLGTAGSVRLTTARDAGRAVSIQLDPAGHQRPAPHAVRTADPDDPATTTCRSATPRSPPPGPAPTAPRSRSRRTATGAPRSASAPTSTTTRSRSCLSSSADPRQRELASRSPGTYAGDPVESPFPP